MIDDTRVRLDVGDGNVLLSLLLFNYAFVFTLPFVKSL